MSLNVNPEHSDSRFIVRENMTPEDVVKSPLASEAQKKLAKFFDRDGIQGYSQDEADDFNSSITPFCNVQTDKGLTTSDSVISVFDEQGNKLKEYYLYGENYETGKIKNIYEKNAQGQTNRSYIDLDYDGEMDTIKNYNAQSNITQLVRADGGKIETATLDDKEHVVERTIDNNGDGDFEQVTTYEYDEQGRITKETNTDIVHNTKQTVTHEYTDSGEVVISSFDCDNNNQVNETIVTTFNSTEPMKQKIIKSNSIFENIKLFLWKNKGYSYSPYSRGNVDYEIK